MRILEDLQERGCFEKEQSCHACGLYTFIFLCSEHSDFAE